MWLVRARNQKASVQTSNLILLLQHPEDSPQRQRPKRLLPQLRCGGVEIMVGRQTPLMPSFICWCVQVVGMKLIKRALNFKLADKLLQ
jgi:hypothetical protein